MIIRKATKEDVKELVKLDKEAHEEIKWWTPMTTREFLKLIKQKLIYIAEDNEIIGYVNGKKENNTLFLDNVFVKRPYRTKGVGKKLVQEFIRYNKNRDILLHCPERLKDFYEKFGFKIKYLVMIKRRG